MPYESDESEWPLCIDRMSGCATDEEVLQYNATRLERLARHEVHVQVVDARGAERAHAGQRQAVAEFNRAHRTEQGMWLAGVALVTDSLMARGILTAVYWLSPPPYPYATFAALDDALTWARSEIATAESTGAKGHRASR